jgi:hypothetical protein
LSLKEFNRQVAPQYCLIQFKYTTRELIETLPNASFFNYNWIDLHKRAGGAICIPESCDGKDVRGIMNKYFDGTDLMQTSDYDQNLMCKKSSEEIRINIFMFILV